MPKKGYDGRFDEFLTFFWKGVGYIILCFFGRGRILVNRKKEKDFRQNFQEMGRRKAPRAHIRSRGTIFSSQFRSKRQKDAQTSFLTKNTFFKNPFCSAIAHCFLCQKTPDQTTMLANLKEFM